MQDQIRVSFIPVAAIMFENKQAVGREYRSYPGGKIHPCFQPVRRIGKYEIQRRTMVALQICQRIHAPKLADAADPTHLGIPAGYL